VLLEEMIQHAKKKKIIFHFNFPFFSIFRLKMEILKILGRLSALTLLLIIGTKILVLDGELSLFSYHPLCAVIAAACIFEAIFALQSINSGTGSPAKQREAQITYHWLMQSIGWLALNFCFYAIYQNKVNDGKNHFTSWHSWAGLTFFIFSYLQAISGSIGYFYPSMVGRYWAAKTIQLHRLFGYLMPICMVCTLALSLYTGFAKRDLADWAWYLFAGSLGTASLALFSSINFGLIFKIFR